MISCIFCSSRLQGEPCNENCHFLNTQSDDLESSVKCVETITKCFDNLKQAHQ